MNLTVIVFGLAWVVSGVLGFLVARDEKAPVFGRYSIFLGLAGVGLLVASGPIGGFLGMGVTP